MRFRLFHFSANLIYLELRQQKAANNLGCDGLSLIEPA